MISNSLSKIEHTKERLELTSTTKAEAGVDKYDAFIINSE